MVRINPNFRNLLDVARDTRGHVRSFISYDALLTDWQGVTNMIATELGLVWPRDGTMARAKIESFPTMRIQHHLCTDESVAANESIVDWVKRTCHTVREATTKVDSIDQSTLDAVREELEKADLAYGSIVLDRGSIIRERGSIISEKQRDICE